MSVAIVCMTSDPNTTIPDDGNGSISDAQMEQMTNGRRVSNTVNRNYK